MKIHDPVFVESMTYMDRRTDYEQSLLIPKAWLFKMQYGTGTPNLVACCVLAELVNMARATGELRMQVNRSKIEDNLGVSSKQTRDAMGQLAELGLIQKELADVEYVMVGRRQEKRVNVPYVIINPEAIARLSE